MKFAERYLMQHFCRKKWKQTKYESIEHILNKLCCEVTTKDEIVLMELVGNNIQNIFFK